MTFIQVKSFLFCIKLKTGVYITGLLSLLGAAFGCIVSALSLKLFLDYLPSRDPTPYLRLYKFSALAFSVITAIAATCGIIVASMLVHGTRKAKPELLKPWMVVNRIGLILHLAQTIGFLWYFGVGDIVESPTTSVLNFVGFLLYFYLLVIVHSYRKENRTEQNRIRDSTAVAVACP